ncbi:MAG: lysophospholipid acyltransferase family protein [Candidatus Cloacimonetes bacterium]|nr:lysophospholipid acyltransferase family protein [Candidatus Cloacimonadota bacterium]
MGLSIATIYLIPEKRFIQNCKVVNRQYVDEAYSHGKGVILATAHLGNWEAARVFPLQEMPTSVIVRQQRNIYFDQFNNAIRSKHGVGMIDMKRGLRDIVAAFRKNEMVAILMDQNAGKSGLIMDFLGFPASHWLGVAKLSLRYKVPILPGFALLNPDGTTEFTFQPIIYHPDWEDDESLYPVLLKEVNEVIERFIHQYPSQWFWVHKRWKATGVMNE